eukprot:CAMPEP_0170747230 /NCGR_PEP_ID=MMETSP0437-20130122/9213_1 /TAXON_ID=0 /ORGANISM="Sexangularia sp." /LENGTH=185 /DNA_ID=CAMNT_0011085997 /DNA_START=61 /DNA_END=614 /DNA_ORIENTATION=+
MSFSSDTQVYNTKAQSSTAVFPSILLGAAGALGGIGSFVGLEGQLAKVCSASPTTWVAVGLAGIVSAFAHAMTVSGNARKLYGLPHPISTPVESDFPKEKDPAKARIAFLNASRGFYNMLEHLPILLPSALYTAQVTGAGRTVGTALIVWSIGRVLFTNAYAYRGPAKRVTGFMISILAQSLILG